MINVVYLKSEKYGHKVIAYDYKNIKRIEVYNGYDCYTESFDDKDAIDFRFSLEKNFCIIDKSEFDQALNKFEATLKEIKEQL
jgi:hypothetical protein